MSLELNLTADEINRLPEDILVKKPTADTDAFRKDIEKKKNPGY